MNEETLVNLPVYLSVALTVLAGAWVAFKGTELYERLSRTAAYKRFELLIKIIEGAVLETEEDMVRKLKAESSTGKLSDDDRVKAFTSARRRAIREASSQLNLDLESVEAGLGGPLGLRTEIERAVERATYASDPPSPFSSQRQGFGIPVNTDGETPL